MLVDEISHKRNPISVNHSFDFSSLCVWQKPYRCFDVLLCFECHIEWNTRQYFARSRDNVGAVPLLATTQCGAVLTFWLLPMERNSSHVRVNPLQRDRCRGIWWWLSSAHLQNVSSTTPERKLLYYREVFYYCHYYFYFPRLYTMWRGEVTWEEHGARRQVKHSAFSVLKEEDFQATVQQRIQLRGL